MNNKKSEQNISVIIRVKGNISEDSKEKSSQLKIINNNSILIESKKKEFFYDFVGDEHTTQNDIFDQCGKKICDYSLEGYNGTIFAYGQTGSGKTYTLLGKNITNTIENNNTSIIGSKTDDFEMSDDSNLNNYSSDIIYDINDENIGLFPRILYYLFKNSSKCKNDENKFIFKISYLEIYKNDIMDLLYPDNKEVQLSDINGVVNLKNLRKLIIESPEEAIKYIIDGNKFRHTASTLMNKESSRSHAIISIYIENNLIKENKIKKSVFHIVDLAGSERQHKTGTSGDRVKEAGSINKSLLNLSIVIKNIINKQKQIPYRDSKLTHILRDSLGGNAKTSIIATISKLDKNIEETICTLNFANNAKKIKNNAIINEELSANDAKILKEKFKNLQSNYNSIFKLYSDLKTKYQIQQNSISERENISKSLEVQNEDLNKMMKDIEEKEENLKKIKEENDNLKDKIQKDDIEFKLKNSEIKEMKQTINDINDKNKTLLNENKKLHIQIIALEEKLKKTEQNIKNMEEMHKNEKKKMEETCENLKNLNAISDEKINKLKEQIIKGEETIKEYYNNLFESKIIIEKKDKDINNLNEIIIQKENKNKDLNDKINEYIKEINIIKNKLDEANKNNAEIKSKGKEMLKKYDEAINKQSLTIKNNENEIKALKQTISQNEKKMKNINEIIKTMEEEKEFINKKLESSRKNISDYLEIISMLQQQNIVLEAAKKEYITELEKSQNYLNTSDYQGLNRNINPDNKMNKKTNNIQNNVEYIKLKIEYDKINISYQKLKRIIESLNENGNKIKDIENIYDKANKIKKDFQEYKTLIKEGIKKIKEIIGIKEDNNNDNLKMNFELMIQLIFDFINKKNEEIKQLKEKEEILSRELKINDFKKKLFDILNAKNNDNNNKGENINNQLDSRIQKRKQVEGYFSKKFDSKIKDKYIKDFDLINDQNVNINNYNIFQGINQNNTNFNK